MKKSLFLLIGFIAISTPYSFGQNTPQDQVTLSTFIPSPVAHYNHVRLSPLNPDLPSPCEPGTIFFSQTTNELVYCEDDGSGLGTGAYTSASGSVWKKLGNNIFPSATAINSDLHIGIGTSTPVEALEVPIGNNVQFSGHSGDFLWSSKMSNLGIGPTDLSNSSERSNVLFNLDSSSAPVAPVRNSRFTVVGGDVIFGDTDHNHIGQGGGGPTPHGGGASPYNAIFTVVGNSDFVGQGYFHDDVTIAGDLSVTGTITGAQFSGSANFSHITTSTLQVTSRGWVGASCPFGSYVEWCVTGDLGYTGSMYSQSDERTKTNIEPLNDGLNIIDQLKPVTFDWKAGSLKEPSPSSASEKSDNQKHIGLIAQEVYKVLPSVVHKPADENKEVWSVSYNELIPVLIQAAKEQKAETDALRTEIEQLKQEIQNLKTSH